MEYGIQHYKPRSEGQTQQNIAFIVSCKNYTSNFGSRESEIEVIMWTLLNVELETSWPSFIMITTATQIQLNAYSITA